MTDVDLDLGMVDDIPTTAELRDPGLFPGFKLFVAQTPNFMGYLACAPFRINTLMSEYLSRWYGGVGAWRRYISDARYVFLDSGAITALLRCAKGQVGADHVYEHLARQDQVIAMAHQLYNDGAPVGVVNAMDLPAYRGLLEPAGLTVEQAEAITVDNAVKMLSADLPPGWKPVFASQGVSIADHERCLERYDRAGILDPVRSGDAWLSVGGMAFDVTSDGRVHQVHRRIRQLMGPDAHIHALGVGRLETLTPMVRRGWVNSADSSRPCQSVRYNRGPYHIDGPRPTFLLEALHAASSLQWEADLAMRVARDDIDWEQDGLFDGEVA